MSAPEPYWSDDRVQLFLGKCEEVLPGLPPESVDSICTDPPYALREFPADLIVKTLGKWLAGERAFVPDGRGFMSREWDKFVPPPAVWDECYRVLKPGGWLTCFAGARTADLMTLSLRLAGFEIRDTLDWIYGSGFPKSLDVSKAIDKAAGAEREVIGTAPRLGGPRDSRPTDRTQSRDVAYRFADDRSVTAPATEAAARWEGWGTALKPAHEPVILARKPLTGTVVANVLAHGTGALNISGCKVEAAGRPLRIGHGEDSPGKATYGSGGPGGSSHAAGVTDEGRWPPNVLLGTEAAAELDRQSGVLTSGANPTRRNSDVFGRDIYGDFKGQRECVAHRGADCGGASRFFPVFRYEAKAPASERPRGDGGEAHNTVKPLDLMRWIVRLVTPPDGAVLDCFAGSGTTAEACLIEGFRCLLIEKGPAYAGLIRKRLDKPIQPVLFGGEVA